MSSEANDECGEKVKKSPTRRETSEENAKNSHAPEQIKSPYHIEHKHVIFCGEIVGERADKNGILG
jgi:hypothetical protein